MSVMVRVLVFNNFQLYRARGGHFLLVEEAEVLRETH